MKIALVTAWTSTVLKFRIDMLRKFVGMGHEVLVIGDEPESKWVPLFRSEGMSYVSYPVSRNGVNPYQDLLTLKSLTVTLKRERPQKIFTYQVKPNIYGCIAAHRAEVADVYPMIGGIGSAFMPNSVRQRLVKRILVAEYRIAFRHIRRAFFQNEDDASVFSDLKIVSREKIVFTRGSGVNVKEYPLTPLPSKTAFLYVGRLIRDKGAYEFLQAARALKEMGCSADCFVVGDLDSNPSSLTYKEIQSFVDDGSVIWYGWRDDVRPYIASCTVFVLPSYREGTPKAALEAMSMGRAVITTDAPGCKEVVCPGENGLLVPVGDAGALADAMNDLANSPHRCAEMGEKSRLIAEKRFDVDLVNETICEAMGLCVSNEGKGNDEQEFI